MGDVRPGGAWLLASTHGGRRNAIESFSALCHTLTSRCGRRWSERVLAWLVGVPGGRGAGGLQDEDGKRIKGGPESNDGAQSTDFGFVCEVLEILTHQKSVRVFVCCVCPKQIHLERRGNRATLLPPPPLPSLLDLHWIYDLLYVSVLR